MAGRSEVGTTSSTRIYLFLGQPFMHPAPVPPGVDYLATATGLCYVVNPNTGWIEIALGPNSTPFDLGNTLVTGEITQAAPPVIEPPVTTEITTPEMSAQLDFPTKPEPELDYTERIDHLGAGVSDWLGQEHSAVRSLQRAGLPVLASAADLARALGISMSRLRWLAYHNPRATRIHYVLREVRKKSGGTRQLMAPLHTLGRVQRWILDNILRPLPVDPACQGFHPGRSIASNAAVHVGQAVVINMDLKDFFPGIYFPRVRRFFFQLGYSGAVATILALLCTEAPRRQQGPESQRLYLALGPRGLPQGACTSPALANQIARSLDRRLTRQARAMGFRYTRYADDLSFSGDEGALPQIGSLISAVRSIATLETFTINEAKTRIQRRHRAQMVTGLVVNERASVARHEIRRLRAILHRARFEGLEAQNHEGHRSFLAWLRGKIAFVSMVRPDLGTRMQTELEALLASRGTT